MFTLIAGVRKVKNNAFPIRPLNKLHRKYPNIRLVFAGPVLEASYWKRLCKELNEDWIEYIGEIPHDKMRSVYDWSDVILNTSLSEGSCNVIAEAMSLGKVILASNIEGNMALVEDKVSGLLYGDELDFYLKSKMLFENKKLRDALGKGAKKSYFDKANSNEIEDYLKLYAEALQTL
jgi:glycosyltransferase involved in cell wall biosynthesis